MTKISLALAAALLAGTTLSAEAGGVRVGFGFPLGSFVAHSNQSQAAGPGNYAARRHCAKTEQARKVERYVAPARKIHVAKAEPKVVHVAKQEPAPRKIKHTPKIEVAEEAPAPRKIKRIPKVEIAEKVEAPVAKAPVQTAKLEDKAIISDAAPTITIPEVKPVETTTSVATTTELPAVTAKDAAPAVTVAPQPAKDEPKVDVPKTETAEKTEKSGKDKPKIKVTTELKKVCRRFSAAIAGLIDVPCE